MKATVETLSPTRVRFDIEVPYSELEPHVQVAYKTVASKVNIPGFRKGKIPSTLIDQRVGRGTVIDEAIQSALPNFYAQAAREKDVLVVGRPSVEIKSYIDNEKLEFSVEVAIRPEITLPDFSKITVEVDDAVVSEKDIDEQVDELRARFGTLSTVERAAKTGDFVTVDLTARIDGKEVDGGEAKDISYEVGSNRMIDGLDAALVDMKAGDTKTFTTQLVGQKDDEKGDVEIKLKAVKERELPPADDAFAKLASEFDTLADLRKDFSTRLDRVKKLEQGAQARDLLLKKLLDELDIPVPEDIVEAEVTAHLEGEGRLADAAHRAEVTEQTNTSIKADFLLDAIARAEQVQANEIELTEYLIRMAQRYGTTPEQFADQLKDAGQLSQLVAEVTRTKALAGILGRVNVVDKSGNKVNLEELRPTQATPEVTE